MKHLFNFYLDDDIKKKACEKLERTNGTQEKGQLAALIRVMLRRYIESPVDKELMYEIAKEYEYSQKLNKRSKL